MKRIRLRRLFRDYRWFQFLEYIFLRYLLLLLYFFSLKAALKIGKYIGSLVYFLDHRHREIGFENLQWVYPLRAVQKEILKRMYQHWVMSAVEICFILRSHRREHLRKLVKIEKGHIVEEILKRGKGCILVIAHLGNWELGGIATGAAGYPLYSVARPLDNMFLDNYVERVRASTGQKIISKYHAWNHMKEVLKQNGILAIVVDQNVRKGGVFVDFFGRKASTTRSPALLSLKYDVPIVPVNIYRDEKGTHRLVVTEPFEPQHVEHAADKVEVLTALYTARLEQFIREHPEQWSWIHKRWKTRPPELPNHVESLAVEVQSKV